MAYKNVVSVKVCGRTMTLTGNESVEYITKVANYIEEKAAILRESSNSKNLSATMVSVLTSINIADDYFKAMEEIERLKKLKGVEKLSDDEKTVSIEEYENIKKQNKKLKSDANELTKAVEAKIGELEGINSELEKKISSLEININNAKDEKATLESRISELEHELILLRDDKERFIIENSGLRSEKNRLETENNKLKSAKEELENNKNENAEKELLLVKADLENLQKLYSELKDKFYALNEDNIKKIAQINHLKSMESRYLEYEKKMNEQKKELSKKDGGAGN